MTLEEAIQILSTRDWSDMLCGYTSEYTEALDMAIEALQVNKPTGEWIKTMDGNGWNEWYVFKCSLCGATIEDKQCRSWEYNFCPNCGTRMKSEVKDI